MPFAIALWSLKLTPKDEPSVFIPQSDLHITNIALSDSLSDENGRTTVKLTYETPIKIGSDDESEDEAEDSESSDTLCSTVLGSLTPGKIEQATIDLVLEEGVEYMFELIGKNEVFLTGNYIDQAPPDQAPFGSDDESDMDEDAYDLREVSSDVEIDPEAIEMDSDGDAGRFEEIVEAESIKSLKRPRESDLAEPEPLSKTAQKKLNKKLKADDGQAVAAGAVAVERKEKKDVGEDKKAKKEKKEKKEKEKSAPPATKTLEGGVIAKDIKVGEGPMAKKGNMVSMRYIGKLDDGKIFDSNTKGAPFKFGLGKGEVIKGWDVGVAGMQAGGERQLTIPAPMAYGKRKMSGIPANSTLTFEVKLLSLK